MSALAGLLALIVGDAVLVLAAVTPGLLLALAFLGSLGRLRRWVEQERARRAGADRYLSAAPTPAGGHARAGFTRLGAVAAAVAFGAVFEALRRSGAQGTRTHWLPSLGVARLAERPRVFRAVAQAATREGPCGPVGAPCWLTGRIDCDGRHAR